MAYSRRKFIINSAITAAGSMLATNAFSAKSYRRILGSNDRVRLGVVGFSDRFRGAHFPSFIQHYKELNFEIVAVSDIWKLRREEGQQFLKDKLGNDIIACKNNDELYKVKDLNGVFISTADFQHALHTVEAVQANCDVYCEKPFAETMADARLALKTVKESKKIV